MAIAFTELTSGESNADAGSYTTASVTLTAGRLYLLGTNVSMAAGTVVAPTAVATTGGAQSFTACDAGIAFSSTQFYESVWRCIPGSNVTATIVITRASGTGAVWSLVEVTGMDTSGTNGSGAIFQITTGQGNSAKTVTLTNNLVAGNARYTFAGINLNNTAMAVTSGTWTSGTGRGHASPNSTGRAAWNEAPAVTDKSAIWTLTSSVVGSTIIELTVPLASGETEFVGPIPL